MGRRVAKMDLFVVFMLLFLLCGINTCHTTVFVGEEELVAAQEEAQYHLEELQKSVARISTLQKRSFRTKRDQEAVRSKRKTDFLFSSLVNFCNQIQDFDENYPNITTETAVSSTPKSSEVEELENENWLEPAVRPIRVQAMRLDEKTVGIQFYIIESTPSVITRIAGLDYEKLEVPKGHGSRDHGGFKIDTSTYCQYSEYEQIDSQFIFHAKDNPVDAVTLRVNVCKFDKFQNQSVPWENRTWETRYGPRREDIKLPKFRIISNITNYDVVLIPGKNISFEMIVRMGRRSHVNLYAVFYDRKAKNMTSDSFSYTIDQENRRAPSKGVTREFLMVDFLQTSVIKNASESEEGSPDDGVIKQIRSRVTLITESGQLTGKLYISSGDRFGTYYEPTVVSLAYLGREINIRKPNRHHVFPRRKVLWQTRTFVCNHEGNQRSEKIGKNCTVACGVIGRDLSSLTISKKGTDIPIRIYRSVAQKWEDRLYTVIDVGPASSDIEGTYVCTVTGARGDFEESREMQLHTSGFPKIDVNETTVVDLGNGTSMIKCVVYGRLPIDVDIEMSVESDSISLTERNDSVQRSMAMDDGKGVVVTLNLPTEDLRYPARVLRFQVGSAFGDDYHSLYLDEVIPDHKGEAKTVPEESGVVNFGNGTTAITCTAIGRPPLTIWMTIGGTQEVYRIDNDPEFLRVETQNDKGKSVTLFAKTRSLIRSYSWLYCVARNEYGFDDTDFYLRDYIVWDLRFHRP